MKKVVLIGDSIRMGYEPTVRSELADIAEVYAPTENGGKSSNVLAHLDEWIVAHSPDIVHINAGLHDLARDPKPDGSTGEPRHSVDQYIENLSSIFEKLATQTRAKVIWARTTPVNEKSHREVKGFERLESDVENFNTAADAVAAAHGLQVNDLYQFVMDAGRDAMLCHDGVHYEAHNSEKIGKHVAGVIRAALGQS